MPPLVLVSFGWGIGLIAAHYWLVPAGVAPGAVCLLALLPAAALLLWHSDRPLRLSSACLLALLLAVLCYQSSLPDLQDPEFVAFYNDTGLVTVEGVVDDYPDERDTRTYLLVAARSIALRGRQLPVTGKVLVSAPRFLGYNYGDALRVTGRLQTPPVYEGFSYKDYLARREIYSIVEHPQIERTGVGQGSPFWSTLFSVKDRAREAIAHLLPDPEGSLLQSILLGIRSGIPDELGEDFQATGTSHILVVSGMNVVVVAALLSQAFTRVLGKRGAFWCVLAGIVVYVLLAGADMPVVRAGVMGSLVLTAQNLGRRSTGTVALCAAGVFLTMLTPLALWDASFQLTFAASLGVILFTPPLRDAMERWLSMRLAATNARTALALAGDPVIATLSALSLTLPIVALSFGRLSLVSPLANTLIAPVQPAIMTWGGAATLVGLARWLEPLAQPLAWVAWLCLAYTQGIVRWMAGWPLASVSISRAAAAWLSGACMALLLAIWAARSLTGVWSRVSRWLTTGLRSKAALTLLVAASILVWLAVLQLPDGRLHVAFLDVGEGDAILITTPRGQQILVDGGPSPAALMAELGRQMPFWDRSLDLVVSTHADADHLTGLAQVLERFRVTAWMDSGQTGSDRISMQCRQLLEAKGVARHTTQAGDRLQLGDGAVLRVLHPSGEPAAASLPVSNDNSIVLRLAMDRVAFLLTADIEAAAEQSLLRSGEPLHADVIKVAHHGGAGSSTSDFLSAVGPAFAVISVGARNPHGHPAPEALDRLAGLGGVQILRTDERGTVEFTTDGREIRVHALRPAPTTTPMP
jgi:competence protein ComEC